MSALDTVLPLPRLLEIDHVDLAIPAARAWDVLRSADLAHHALLVRALFAIRTATQGSQAPVTLRISDLTSSISRPGFQVLAEQPGSEVVVGAIGKVWHLEIPFVHVGNADAFAAFATPGFAKVAWALRVVPRGAEECRVEIEVRVDATDEDAWGKFRRYFVLIGPGSRFIRHSLLSGLARQYGTPDAKENERPLPGDELLPDATDQVSLAIDVQAPPSALWPWIVQMGGHRAGFYSIDLLDNENVRSARELHPEWGDLKVGDVIPATRSAAGGFEVLRIARERELVLGGLFDPELKTQLRFDAPRPLHFWQITWSFVLEPRGDGTTRLHTRARARYASSGASHAAWIRPVHWLMQTAQLRALAARAEGRLPRDDWRDVAEGAGGALVMAAAFLTPFMRHARRHWGIDEATARRPLPGDELVAKPDWDWTHGIEIAASAAEVWPWIAQIGAERGGFYSYQWLENVAGCKVQNAERVHPELAVGPHDSISLHPKMPPLPVARYEAGSYFVVHAKADPAAPVETSWGFYLEPLGEARCRFVSRFRCAMSPDALAHLEYGPLLVEPIGFAMDRRMLLGVKARAEAAKTAKTAKARKVKKAKTAHA